VYFELCTYILTNPPRVPWRYRHFVQGYVVIIRTRLGVFGKDIGEEFVIFAGQNLRRDTLCGRSVGRFLLEITIISFDGDKRNWTNPWSRLGTAIIAYDYYYYFCRAQFPYRIAVVRYFLWNANTRRVRESIQTRRLF